MPTQGQPPSFLSILFRACCLFASTLCLAPLGAQVYDWQNFAGTPNELTDATARNQFSEPRDVAVDAAGNVYVVDWGQNRICKILPGGQVIVLAGGTQGSADGYGSEAQFTGLWGIAVDSQGMVYVTDRQSVRKITAQGEVTTLAGVIGQSGTANGTGSAARFGILHGIAVSSTGIIYVADSDHHTIRKITPAGEVTTFSGKAGEAGTAVGSGNVTRFNDPTDVSLDPDGNMYVADYGNDRICKVTPAGLSSVITSWPWNLEDWYVGPAHVLWTPNGLYISDIGFGVVYKHTAGFGRSTVAGVRGFQGNTDGPTGTSRFRHPWGLAADATGNVYVADRENKTIRKISTTGMLTTYAGSVGSEGSVDAQGSSARFRFPTSIGTGNDGTLYVADRGNFTIRQITPEGEVSTLAGRSGAYGLQLSSDGIFLFQSLGGLGMDGQGNVWAASTTNYTVRKITPEGEITSFYRQDRPFAIAIDSVNNVYLVDADSSAIIKITPAFSRTILAGGTAGDSDGSGAAARFNQPRGLYADAEGNVYVADTGNHKIRKVSPAGHVTTVVGTSALLSSPEGVTLDDEGTLYIADTGNHVIRKVLPSGLVTTIGGTRGMAGGQNGIGKDAGFCSPSSLTLGADGALYVADRGNHRISRGQIITQSAKPSIRIEMADGTIIDEPGEIAEMGTLTTVQQRSQTFTLRNTGNATLHFTGTPSLVLSPASGVPFWVFQMPEASVAPGQTTLFSINYYPSTVGQHEAEVHIPTNNPVLNPFTFTIRGQAVAPAHVTLDASAHVLNQGATQLEVTVRRTGRTAPFSVNLTTVEVEAQHMPPFAAGLAGTDFQNLNTTLNFAEGEMEKQVTVTLLPRTGNKVPNIKFGMYLHWATEGNVITPVSFADVHVLANDSLAPSLKLTTPGAKDSSIALPMQIKGTVGDAMGVDRVEVSLNGAAPVTAVLWSSARSTSIPFTATIQPDDAASYELKVTAYDLKGNQTVLTRNFGRQFVLQLDRQVPERLVYTPDKAGKFTLAGSPRGWGTKPTAQGTASVLPGTQVKVSTTVAKNLIFSHWENLPAGAEVNGTSISFIMPEADVPGLKAVFLDNPFTLPGGSQYFKGSRACLGLLLPAEGTQPGNHSVGQINASLVASKATLSGKLAMDGRVQSFTGILYGDGSVWFKSGKLLVPALDLQGLTLSMVWTGSGLQATVEGEEGTVSEGLARPAYFNKAQPVPAGLMNRSRTQGYFTLAWPAKDQVPSRDPASFPQGSGYAAFKLSNLGVVKLAGVLADGTKITASSALGQTGGFPFFVALPTPGESAKVKGGSVAGTMSVHLADGSLTAPGCLWFRPAVIESSKPATHLYTEGWPEGLQMNAFGAAYNASLTVQDIVSPSGSLLLRLEGGRLAEPVEKENFSVSGSKLAKQPSNDKTVTLKVSASTGFFSAASNLTGCSSTRSSPSSRASFCKELIFTARASF